MYIYIGFYWIILIGLELDHIGIGLHVACQRFVYIYIGLWFTWATEQFPPNQSWNVQPPSATRPPAIVCRWSNRPRNTVGFWSPFAILKWVQITPISAVYGTCNCTSWGLQINLYPFVGFRNKWKQMNIDDWWTQIFQPQIQHVGCSPNFKFLCGMTDIHPISEYQDWVDKCTSWNSIILDFFCHLVHPSLLNMWSSHPARLLHNLKLMKYTQRPSSRWFSNHIRFPQMVGSPKSSKHI